MSEVGGGGYGSIPSGEDAPAPAPEASLTSKLVAEVIGTATLVQIGTGGICAAVYMGAMKGLLPIAALWILGGMLGVYASGSISGGHLNPAVSAAFALLRPRDFPLKHLLLYWSAQLVGGILAGVINMLIFSVAIANYEDKNGIIRGEADGIKSAVGFGDYYSLSKGVGSTAHAFFIEAFGTAFLVFVIFAATHANNNVPSSAIAPIVGVAIGTMIALLGSLTGAGINPARDLGPRLVTLMWGWGSASMTGWWVYVAAPLVGGPIGAAIADMLLFA